MKRVTLDASVISKWFLQTASNEPDLLRAKDLLDEISSNRLMLAQPPHWLAEVLNVVVRRRPEQLTKAVAMLGMLNAEVRFGDIVHLRAAEIARETGAHMFDTLYHAVALEEPDGMLITADLRYYEAARPFGCIARLDEFHFGVAEPSMAYIAIARRAMA